MKAWSGLGLLFVAVGASELRPPALYALAPGAVAPEGWLLAEAKLMGAGLTGQLPSFWSYLVDSAWLGGKGNAAPEQYVPYYLNGLVPLSFQLGGDGALASLREGLRVSPT